MKTFAFIASNSLKDGYQNLLSKYRSKDLFVDSIKIGFLFFILLFALFVYLRYVSLSSTYGYFLRQENQNLNNVSFEYEIYKTQILNQKQKNREEINDSSFEKRDVILVNAQIVTIPVTTELSMK